MLIYLGKSDLFGGDVDNWLFFLPKQEYIDDDVIHIQQHEQGTQVDQDVARFLGVHQEYKLLDDSVTLTQTGLIKQIVIALGVGNEPIKSMRAEQEPLVMDYDGNPPNTTYIYANVIGMLLQYLLSHLCLDITYAMNQCARYVHCTQQSHELALEHI